MALAARSKRLFHLAHMGKLTTHILDTANGRPAAAMTLELFRLQDGRHSLARSASNSDGRLDAPLLEGASFSAGRYELVFDVADYFRRLGQTLPEPPFLDQVVLRFGIADPTQHYHLPLLVSPWSYSTYRGS
jgi:5-hydroxyisourate hydrolase